MQPSLLRLPRRRAYVKHLMQDADGGVAATAGDGDRKTLAGVRALFVLQELPSNALLPSTSSQHVAEGRRRRAATRKGAATTQRASPLPYSALAPPPPQTC